MGPDPTEILNVLLTYPVTPEKECRIYVSCTSGLLDG